jgi:hypothetical protein
VTASPDAAFFDLSLMTGYHFLMKLAFILSAMLLQQGLAGCSKNELCRSDFPCLDDNPTTTPGGADARRPADARTAPIDAVVVAGDITGRVCLITNFADPFTCATTGADGIVVGLGINEATTAADGTFTIAAPAGAPPAFEIKRADLTRCLTPFLGGNTANLTAVKTDYYRQFLSDNGMVVVGTGTLLAQLKMGTSLAAGETLVLKTGTQPYPTRYDAPGAIWGRIATGPKGVAILAGLAVGSAEVVAGPRVLSQIPIEASTITIVGFQLQ